jgi:hypothetical protein
MTARDQRRWRFLSATICLLSVVLLYAPLALASWSSHKAACCTLGQCPIPEHHRHKVPTAPMHHMDCGHEMPGMAACSMSCCQNPDRPAVTPVVFVLPVSLNISGPAGFTSAIELLKFPDLPRSIEPLSPPPRLVATIA